MHFERSVFAGVHANGAFRCPSGKESAYQCRRRQRQEWDPWVGKIHCSRKWQPTPVLPPEKFQGQRSLSGYSPWGCRELDMTEHTRAAHSTCKWARMHGIGLYGSQSGGKHPTSQSPRLYYPLNISERPFHKAAAAAS